MHGRPDFIWYDWAL